jgi:shikimate kinase
LPGGAPSTGADVSAKRNVYLIGQPGVGKTTLGRIVAELLGRTFFDLDR